MISLGMAVPLLITPLYVLMDEKKGEREKERERRVETGRETKVRG